MSYQPQTDQKGEEHHPRGKASKREPKVRREAWPCFWVSFDDLKSKLRHPILGW